MFAISFLLEKMKLAGKSNKPRKQLTRAEQTSLIRTAVVFAAVSAIAGSGFFFNGSFTVEAAAAAAGRASVSATPQKSKNKRQKTNAAAQSGTNGGKSVPVERHRLLPESADAPGGGLFPLDPDKDNLRKPPFDSNSSGLSESQSESSAAAQDEENDGEETVGSNPNGRHFNIQRGIKPVSLADIENQAYLFAVDEVEAANDPDTGSKGRPINKEAYMRLREEYIALRRGIDPENPTSLDPTVRARAIEFDRAKPSKMLNSPNAPTAAWVNIGPAPIPNGQLQQRGVTAPVTGRSTAIVVDPTNSNKVYLGTAQGGVWRSLDGGTTWTAIFDSAQSLAVGALTLDPRNPTTLFVGTGESNQSLDSFAGVGVYRIINADTTATLQGPFATRVIGTGTGASNGLAFQGTGINRIVIDPNDSNKMYVGNGIGRAGVSGTQVTGAFWGLYYCGNALAATPTFSRVNNLPGSGNGMVIDIEYEPGSSSNLLIAQYDAFGLGTAGASVGGIYRSTNADAASSTVSPTFTFTQPLGIGILSRLAVNKTGATVTAYAATSESPSTAACVNAGNSGKVRKSVDGGATFPTTLTAADGFCGGQCTYDSPIEVSPTNANLVYLGGNARGVCSDVLKRSADGGATFARDDTGLHADSHFIFFDVLTATPTVWFANDGGVWKRPDAAPGTPWLNENNTPLSITQFQSLALHPRDRNYTIGGTQDNGTEAQQATSDGWVSAEGGDGGFTLIDQSAVDTVNVTMYHTFYNVPNSQILFDRANLSSCLAIKDSWSTRGPFVGSANVVSADDPSLNTLCDGTPDYIGSNGIQISDNVLFYAPMALGPGTPNTLYFATDRLYRSTDKGDSMSIVSQSPINPTGTRVPAGGAVAVPVGTQISAVGISPVSDNVRIVGLINGQVWATTTGSTTLTNTGFVPPANLNGSTTSFYISRAVPDPSNVNTAYITLSYYTNVANAGQVFKTTNLNSPTPTWTSVSGTGANALPNVPVNAFVVDKNDSTLPGKPILYAGTDIGVYSSIDDGTTWTLFGTGLPRVAVFDMAIQQPNRVLRVATHGRGMFEINLPAAPTAGEVTVGGRVTMATGGRGVRGAVITMTDQNGVTRAAYTTTFGYYRFDNVAVGETYVFGIKAKRFTFEQPSQVLNINETTNAVNFTVANR